MTHTTEPQPARSVAETIDLFMRQRSMSDEDLADLLDLHPEVIVAFREGVIDVPFTLIPGLASAFDVHPRDLMATAFVEYGRGTLLAIGRSFLWEQFGHEQAMMDFFRDMNDGEVPDIVQEPGLFTKLKAAIEAHKAERSAGG